MENITYVDHRHAKRVFKSLNNKTLRDYHDLYVQSDTLLLTDVFQNFKNKCIKIYELDPAHFLSAPGLAWQACLKEKELELELLTNADMLLMVEKGIRGGICHAIYRYAKANNKYMENYDDNIIIYSVFRCKQFVWMEMSRKLPVDGFKWKKKYVKI